MANLFCFPWVSVSASFLLGPHLNRSYLEPPAGLLRPRASSSLLGVLSLCGTRGHCLGYRSQGLIHSAMTDAPPHPCPGGVLFRNLCFGANWEKACTHCWAGRSTLECPAPPVTWATAWGGLMGATWAIHLTFPQVVWGLSL